MRNAITKNLKIIKLVNRVQFLSIIILLEFIPSFVLETYNFEGRVRFKDVFLLFEREYNIFNPIYEYYISYLAILFVCFVLLILVFKYKSIIFEVLVSLSLIALIVLAIDYKFSNARIGFYLLLGSILLNLVVLICLIVFSETKYEIFSKDKKAIILNKSRTIRHLAALYLFSALPIFIMVEDYQNTARVGLFFFAENADYYYTYFVPPLGRPFFSYLGANLHNSIGMNTIPIIELIIVIAIFLLLLEKWKFQIKNITIEIKYIFSVLVVLFIVFTAIFHRYVGSGAHIFIMSLVSPILLYLMCPWILLPYFLIIREEQEHNTSYLGFAFFLLQNCIILTILILSNAFLIELREYHIIEGYTIQFTLNLLVLPFIASKIFLNRKKEKEITGSVLD